jgi:hypothetical protein
MLVVPATTAAVVAAVCCCTVNSSSSSGGEATVMVQQLLTESANWLVRHTSSTLLDKCYNQPLHTPLSSDNFKHTQCILNDILKKG